MIIQLVVQSHFHLVHDNPALKRTPSSIPHTAPMGDSSHNHNSTQSPYAAKIPYLDTDRPFDTERERGDADLDLDLDKERCDALGLGEMLRLRLLLLLWL